jgi:hypothetical protein
VRQWLEIFQIPWSSTKRWHEYTARCGMKIRCSLCLHNFAKTLLSFFARASITSAAPLSPDRTAPSIYPFHSNDVSVPTKWIASNGSLNAFPTSDMIFGGATGHGQPWLYTSRTSSVSTLLHLDLGPKVRFAQKHHSVNAQTYLSPTPAQRFQQET